MKNRCTDCAIDLVRGAHCEDAAVVHAGECCDCFDESFGMKGFSRQFPRPEGIEVKGVGLIVDWLTQAEHYYRNPTVNRMYKDCAYALAGAL